MSEFRGWMRLKVAAVLVLAALGSMCCPVRAAEPPVFGQVDVAMAVMLHPLMRYYHPNHRLFNQKALGGKPSARPTLGAAEADAQRAQLLARLADVDTERQKLSKSYTKAFQELTPQRDKIEKLIDASAKKAAQIEYNKKKASLMTEFEKENKGLAARQTQLKAELAAFDRDQAAIGLCTRDESNGIIRTIADDVFAAVNEVAERYKVAFVFNSSFLGTSGPLPVVAQDLQLPPTNAVLEFLELPADKVGGQLSTGHGEDGFVPVFARMSEWLASARPILQSHGERRLGMVFLRGGVDMTPAVIDRVYDKFGVSASHRKVLGEYVNMIRPR